MIRKMEFEEIVILKIINTSTLMPHYWSDFVVTAKQLLNHEQEKRLASMVREVEKMVLEEEFYYNVFVCKSKECNHVWRTEDDWYEVASCPKCKSYDAKLVQERHSLYDIEMAIESNRDFTAFFNRYGAKIYKFDIERKLNKIKEWVFVIVKEKAQSRRFTRMM
jgi:predicted Zn-ribbon and HTH transcriptional regulator